jgi:NACHT domain
MPSLNEQDRDLLYRIASGLVAKFGDPRGANLHPGRYIEPTLKGSDGRIRVATEVLQTERRILILGDFGAGKTTLLHRRALFSARKFLNREPNAKCPFFITARCLQGPSSYLDAMRNLLMDEYQISIQLEQFLPILNSGSVELFVDGLDERPTDSSEFSNYLAMLFRQAPRLDGLIATRPSGLPSNLFGFANYWIQPFDDEQIYAFIDGSFGGDKVKVAEVRQIIAATYDLEDLAKRPLLLGMTIDVFRRFDWVPENPAALFELFIDQSLKRDSAKGRTRKSGLSNYERLQILGRLASEIFETGNLALSRDAVTHIINDCLDKRGVDANEILIDLQETSFLRFDTEA